MLALAKAAAILEGGVVHATEHFQHARYYDLIVASKDPETAGLLQLPFDADGRASMLH